jgi:single-strand DNA-binding protein
MSQGAFVTLVGFVAREPRLRETRSGRHVADLRVGTTTRIIDKATGQWADGETSYYTVNCWRRLADHVKASLRKGDPVVVKGRFRTNSYEDKTGRLHAEIEIVADTVGHDLNRGIANYIRPERPRVHAAAGPAPAGAGSEAGEPEDMTEGAADRDLIDEEALERFERELDASLDDASLDDASLDDASLDDAELAGQGLERDAAAEAAGPGS